MAARVTKTITREAAEEKLRQSFFLLKCPYCGEELVIEEKNLKKRLFEPHKEKYEYWEGGFGDEFKKIGTRMVSSDSDKDVYENIKCCSCGHVWDEPCKNFYEKRCNADGRQVITFSLNEEETKKAEEFRNKHNHNEDFRKQGKLGFTALGQQFTYTITPCGLGPCISIKCNYCGESEDLTDIGSW